MGISPNSMRDFVFVNPKLDEWCSTTVSGYQTPDDFYESLFLRECQVQQRNEPVSALQRVSFGITGSHVYVQVITLP